MLNVEFEKRTGAELVSDALRTEILSGRIPSGVELNQTELAQRMGLSRMPVREAMIQLENECLLERLDNRHMRVIGLDEDGLSVRLGMLAPLEAQALSRLTQDDAAKLADCLDRRNHKAFHDQVFSLCQERFIAQVYSRLFERMLGLLLQQGSQLPDESPLRDIVALVQTENHGGVARATERYYADLQRQFREEASS